MAEFDDFEIDLDNVDEASSSFDPAPPGTHLCRLEVEDLKTIGNQGSLGWKVRGKIVEPNNQGRVAEDILFLSEAAKPRLKLALHRIGGMADGKVTAAQVRQMLDGKLARLTVSEVVFNKKGDKTDYTETQAKEMRAAGEKVYGHAKLAFAGYETPTAEEIAKYGQKDPGQTATKANSKLPF